MPVYRTTMVISSLFQPSCSFTERWDVTAATPAVAKGIADTISTARARMLSSSWIVLVTRIGELSVKIATPKNKLKQTVINLCPEIASKPGALGVGDSPNSAIYAKALFASGYKPRAQQFRGIPDTWWADAALAGGTVRPLVNRYANSLKTAGVGRATITTGETPTVVVVALECMDVRRISSRRTGRPFALLRGRRSKRRVLPA